MKTTKRLLAAIAVLTLLFAFSPMSSAASTCNGNSNIRDLLRNNGTLTNNHVQPNCNSNQEYSPLSALLSLLQGSVYGSFSSNSTTASCTQPVCDNSTCTDTICQTNIRTNGTCDNSTTSTCTTIGCTKTNCNGNSCNANSNTAYNTTSPYRWFFRSFR